MTENIKMGSILIEGRTLLPDSVWLESEKCTDGWIVVKNLDGIRLGRKVREAGWSLSPIADEIRANTCGFNAGKTTRRAIQRILVKLRPAKFNCLQITQVVANHFLGLSYVSVSAHAQHIRDPRVSSSSKLAAA